MKDSTCIYNCEHYNIFSVNFILNILIGVTIFGIFLTIFYFTYAAKIEEEIVNLQMKNLVDDFTYNLDILQKEDQQKITDYLNKLELPNTDELDKEVEESNKKIIRNAMIFLGVFSGIMILGSILLYVLNKDKISIKYLILNNVILLIFVAVTEIFFLNLVAKKYNSLDPNVIKLKIIEKLQDLGK
jgi:uncharacterized protein YacL